MGLFSTKTKIYVSGGISRVRPDKLILNTTGLVVSNASINNLDIADEIRLNELTGTKASYKSFWRKATKYGLVPTGTASYYVPNKEELAQTIRTDTGNAYPLADDLITIDTHPVKEDEWVKFKLQDSHNYTITTDPLTNNVLTYSDIDYYLDDYTYVPILEWVAESGGEIDWSNSYFTINASRNKKIETTVTKRFYVYYADPIYRDKITTTTVTRRYWFFYYDAKWWVKVEEQTQTSITYNPADTTTNTDSGWYIITSISGYTFDSGVQGFKYPTDDPWSLGLVDGVPGSNFYHCEGTLCDPTVSVSTVSELVSPSIWRVREDTHTEVNWSYEPAAPSGGIDDTGWVETGNIAYDTIGDPAGLNLPSEGGTAFYHCHENLCDPIVTDTVEVETVTFSIYGALPASTKTVYDSDNYPFEIANNYWSVLYVHQDKYYLWIVDTEVYPNALGEEKDVNDALQGILEEFAPVIATRNDFVDYTTGDHYTKANKALKLIGLDVDSINEAVSTDNPEIDNIADTYVTLQSALLSEHQDELGYNYAFFDKLREINNLLIDISGSSEDISETLGSFDKGSGRMSINVISSGIYSQRVSWGKITKTTKTGVLSKEYEATLVEYKETELWLQNSYGTYTIRKRIKRLDGLPSNTYSEIVVSRLQTEYFVFYNGDLGKSYKVDWDITGGNTDQNKASISQLTIPVSLAIAKEAIPRDLETFFLRTTHIGIFSRVIVKTKWYQSGFFSFIMKVIAIVAIVWGAYQIALEISFAVAATTAVTATAISLVILGIIAKYAIISVALKTVLVKALESTKSNFLRALIVVAFVYASYRFVDTSNFSTPQKVDTVLKSLTTAINTVTQVDIADLHDAIASFDKEQATFEQIIKDLGLEKDNGQKKLQADYLNYWNTFARDTSTIYTQQQAELATDSYKATISSTLNYVKHASTVDIAKLFTNTDYLVAMRPSGALLPT